MRKNIMSDSFSYKSTDCIIMFDGGILSKYNISSIGWVIKDFKTQIKLAEGRAITSKNLSTTDIELFGAIVALLEAREMNMNNILLQTDFNGFIKHLSKNTNTSLKNYSKLNKILNTFETWSVEKVNRNKISRPHNLSSSINKERNYSPKVNFDNI